MLFSGTEDENKYIIGKVSHHILFLNGVLAATITHPVLFHKNRLY